MGPIEGLVAATFTPMHENGDLYLGQITAIVERLIAEGVAGLFVCGSTGEGASLSAGERRATAEAHVAAAGGRIPVIVQVGHDCLREARALAAHAQRAGADAIAAAPPSYFRPGSVEALARSLAEVAAGAPELPLYYYHIPVRSHVDCDVTELLRAAPATVPSLAGVKFSAPDLHELAACAAFDGGRYEIMFGCDEMLLAGLGAGARSAVGATYNLAAPLFNRIVDAHRRGDLAAARGWQGRAVAGIDVLRRHGGLPAFKAAMGLIGLECGPVRLPQTALDPALHGALRADLEEVGFFAQRGG